MDEGVDNRHIIRSDDGKVALWAGAIDDLWALGKPAGVGGPWLNTQIEAGTVSDPYLMTGYDKKTLELNSSADTRITAEVDISGMGDWHLYKTFDLTADKILKYEFPDSFKAYWIRVKSSRDSKATAWLIYE